MPPVAAPVWWEDVQQEREDFAGRTRRPVDEWLDEDLDFTPRRRLPRRSADSAVVLELDLYRVAHGPADPEPIAHGDPYHVPVAEAETAVDGGTDADLRPGGLHDERFLAPPPPDGARRMVHIKGRPEAARAPLPSRRHRPRTAAQRIGPRPDRVALYAVIFGVILILIALSSASPS